MESKIRLIYARLNYIHKLCFNHLVLQNLPKLDNIYIHLGYINSFPLATGLIMVLSIGNIGPKFLLFDKLTICISILETKYNFFVFNILGVPYARDTEIKP